MKALTMGLAIKNFFKESKHFALLRSYPHNLYCPAIVHLK